VKLNDVPPLPLFVTEILFGVGFAPPSAAEKRSVDGFAESMATGAGALTTRVTETVFGLLAAPAAVTTTEAVCVPAESPVAFTDTMALLLPPDGREPLTGLTLSQLALSLTV
jgi:hypothetical protein